MIGPVRVLEDGSVREIALPEHVVSHADAARRALEGLYRALLAGAETAEARSTLWRQRDAALAAVETSVLVVLRRSV